MVSYNNYFNSFIYFFLCIFVYLGGQSPNVSSVGTPVSGNTCSTPISKSMITNASFRTKKLPGKKKTIFVHLDIKLCKKK